MTNKTITRHNVTTRYDVVTRHNVVTRYDVTTRYDVAGVPPCVEVYRGHPLWCYVCPLLLEEYDWFSRLKGASPFGHLLQRYWPECIGMFFGWLDNHPEYGDEEDARRIHGVNSARRAFEAFCSPASPSGMALRATLECRAAQERHEPLAVAEILHHPAMTLINQPTINHHEQQKQQENLLPASV